MNASRNTRQRGQELPTVDAEARWPLRAVSGALLGRIGFRGWNLDFSLAPFGPPILRLSEPPYCGGACP